MESSTWISYWVYKQEAAITKCCLAGGTVPGHFLQCVKNPKEKLKLAKPSLWTTGEQKFTEFVSFVADLLSSHGEITLHIYKALCLVCGKMKKGAPINQNEQRKYSTEVPINKWWIALGMSQSYQPCSSGRKILLQGTSVKAACTKCMGSVQKGGWGEISREWQWLRSWEVLQKGDKIWE